LGRVILLQMGQVAAHEAFVDPIVEVALPFVTVLGVAIPNMFLDMDYQVERRLPHE